MVAAIRGLNARSLRALELTQAAWRRDRFDKLEKEKVHCREDFVSYPLVIMNTIIYLYPLSSLTFKHNGCSSIFYFLLLQNLLKLKISGLDVDSKVFWKFERFLDLTQLRAC